ncbi:MAG: DUF2723 domain-containing protein [Chloroflexota bacterium]|nr:DUF2723 domain-containing protein [Chloroflexota bacterium]
MRPLPDNLSHIAGVGGAGVVWGLGLARLAAEAGFWTPLYGSPLLVAVVAIVCAGLAILLWLWMDRSSPPRTLPSNSRELLWVIFLPSLYVTGVVSHPLAGGVLLVGGGVLALLVMCVENARWIPPTALGLVVMGLYLHTLLPSVGQADTFEFQVIVPLLRVAHPTGYPLYVLLGKLFTLLPLGNVAWRVSLASAVFATTAVLVLYALLLRLTAQWLPAFLAALAFAFSSTFWSQAIVAEVYALHNLLLVVILWLLFLLSEGDRGREAHRWQVIFFLIGLSFTNHLTTALLLPSVAIALLWDRPRLRPKDWLIAGVFLILGLSVYLFIPLRWPALNRGEWMKLPEFISYVTGGQFHGALRLNGWRDPVRWSIVGRLLREPFGWIGLGLAAAGVMGLAARQRRALALTGVAFLAFFLYGLDYYVPDISVFLLPAHLILAVWIGAGVVYLSDIASRLSSFATHHSLLDVGYPIFITCYLSFSLLPLSRIWVNLPLVDQSHNQGGYTWGQYVLSLPLSLDSAVLADVEKFAPLYYLQQIEGMRPDLDLLLFGSEEHYYVELAARLEAGQTIYLARYLPNLDGLHLRSLGPLVEVRDPVFVKNQVSGEASARFGEGIRLLDAELNADSLGRAMHHLTLHWQADTQVSGDFVVRLRLVDTEGQVRWESDGARPVGGLYPTNAWPVGVAISDYHAVLPPPWLPRGVYGLEVGLFPPFGDAGLGIDGGATAWLALDTLEIARPSGSLPPLPHERRFGFADGGWLTGYNLSDEAPAGASFVADFSWHGVETDEEVRLTWVDTLGQEVGVAVFPLTAGVLRSHHVVTVPQRSGDYTLHVGLTGEDAHCGWLASPADDCPFATVKVTPAQEGLANFAGLVLLLDAGIGQSSVQPGDSVPVALRWRGLRAMDEDYTVSVQLIGPDGRLHGQVDMWPVQGSYPTSRWSSGEELGDPYEVRLAPDAPPGDYRVEVGWYLLATMQRLPVLDASGQPVSDSFVVGEFSVGD